MAHIIQPLFQHFQELLEVYETCYGTVSNPGMAARIASNLANIHSILVKGLRPDNPDLVNTIYCACYYDHFSILSGRGWSNLIDLIPQVMPHPRNYRLEVHFNLRVLSACGLGDRPIADAQPMVDQTLESFTYFNDADLKCWSHADYQFTLVTNISPPGRFYDILSEYFYSGNNEIPRGIHFAETGLSLSISTGNIRRQADLLGTLALMKWRTGDYLGGQKQAYMSRKLAKICGNPYIEATALNIESTCWYSLGSYKHSIALLRRARDLLRLCGMSGGELDNIIISTQAEVHLAKSEYLDAWNIQTQILHSCSMEQTPYQHALALLSIAHIDVEIGVLGHELHKNLATASQLFACMGHSKGLISCDIVKARLDLKEGHFLTVKSLFQTSVITAWGKDTEIVSYCLETLGDVCLWPATDDVSYNAPVTFLVHSLKVRQKLQIHKALQFLGDVYLVYGDQQTATSLFVVALEGLTQMDVHRSRAECMLRLGDLVKLQGDLVKAGELWKTMRPLFKRSSQQKQMADIDERLAGINSEQLDSPTQDLHAPPTASPDELDLGVMNIPLSKVEEVESLDDSTYPVLVPA
ncbi:hypothetical protein FB451DRAFT_1185251 [Mycena latifolia]|nr:hypothetical protein FB451DRAFT_1185251 [Mycena latifolia]